MSAGIFFVELVGCYKIHQASHIKIWSNPTLCCHTASLRYTPEHGVPQQHLQHYANNSQHGEREEQFCVMLVRGHFYVAFFQLVYIVVNSL